MNRILKVILVIIFVLGSLTTACQSGGGTGETSQGTNPAPQFQFTNNSGQLISLSDLRGKPVLINFWATWCSPCRMEMPYIQQIYNEWQEKGLVLLAINIGESASRVAEFMRSQGFSFPVLLDPEGEIAGQYGVRAIPTSFFIDKDGIIQDMKVGPFHSKAEIESGLSKLTNTR